MHHENPKAFARFDGQVLGYLSYDRDKKASAPAHGHLGIDIRLYFRIFLNSATRLMPRNLAVRARR